MPARKHIHQTRFSLLEMAAMQSSLEKLNNPTKPKVYLWQEMPPSQLATIARAAETTADINQAADLLDIAERHWTKEQLKEFWQLMR